MSEIEIESRSLPLATIGYEASILPRVIQSLQAASVDLLIDIRAVASSRKAGFSKTLLGASLEAEGIGYRHLRDLGTPKAGRQAARAGRTAQMQSIFNAHMQTDAARGALEQAIEAGGAGAVKGLDRRAGVGNAIGISPVDSEPVEHAASTTGL